MGPRHAGRRSAGTAAHRKRNGRLTVPPVQLIVHQPGAPRCRTCANCQLATSASGKTDLGRRLRREPARRNAATELAYPLCQRPRRRRSLSAHRPRVPDGSGRVARAQRSVINFRCIGKRALGVLRDCRKRPPFTVTPPNWLSPQRNIEFVVREFDRVELFSFARMQASVVVIGKRESRLRTSDFGEGQRA